MADLPILYSFRRCPYAMRARLALVSSGQPVAIREVRLRDKPSAMLAASPKGTVPVLVFPDGRVIDESIDIMGWALRQSDPGGWLNGDDAALIAANDGPFKYGLDRYKYPGRHGSDPLQHRDMAVHWMLELEKRLRHGGYLCGEKVMLTDMAILPFIRQFAAVDPSWFDTLPLPRLRDWLNGLIASDVFARAMVKLDPWRVGDADVTFPT